MNPTHSERRSAVLRRGGMSAAAGADPPSAPPPPPSDAAWSARPLRGQAVLLSELSDDLVVDIIASQFHDTYERLAPEHGYETREGSRKPWGDVPDNNRALMRATVRHLLRAGIIHVR
jgi:hypothetical protein